MSIKFNTTDVGLVIVLALIVLTPKPTSVKTTVLAYNSKSQATLPPRIISRTGMNDVTIC